MAGGAMTSAEKLRHKVDELWHKHRPLTLERLETVRRAIHDLSVGESSEDLLQAAIADAHKLAGSLGTFGMPEASESAREIERLLRTERPVIDTHFQNLKTHLRELESAITAR
jgi:HPt (histidine-containing phosphotransfer) domain-containing protein